MDPINGNPQKWAQNCFFLCKQRICAHEEAILSPLLRISVDWVHVEGSHTCANEKHGQHGGEIHRGGGGHQSVLCLAGEIGGNACELSPSACDLDATIDKEVLAGEDHCALHCRSDWEFLAS